MSTKIGFVGLGIMGAPMAANLVKAGFEVTGYNRSPEPVEQLVAAGGRGAKDIAEAVREADVVATMVPDSPDVQAVLAGAGGVFENAPPGALVIFTLPFAKTKWTLFSCSGPISILCCSSGQPSKCATNSCGRAVRSMRSGVRPRDVPSTRISAPLGSLVTFVSALTKAKDFLVVSPRCTSIWSRISQSPRRAVMEYLPVGTSPIDCGVTPSRKILPSSLRSENCAPGGSDSR